MIQRLHHLVLFYRDAEAARWWLEKAGFEYLRGHAGMHWLALGEAEIMVHPAEKSSGGSGLVIHVGVDDAEAHFRAVVERGLVPIDHQCDDSPLEAPVKRPWGDIEFELVDPEGHRWAFTQI